MKAHKFAVFPLAVAIALGFSGCGNGIYNPGMGVNSSENNISPRADPSNVSRVSELTLGKVFALSTTDEFQAINASLSEKAITSVDELKAILSQHKEVTEKSLRLVEFDKQNREEYKRILLASESSSKIFKDLSSSENESTLEQIMALGVISTVGTAPADTTLHFVDNGVSKTESGKIQVSEQSVYFLDENGGLKEFLSSGVKKLFFSADGKKISIQTVAEQAREDNAEKMANSMITSDVQDAAAAVESYIALHPGGEIDLTGKESTVFKGISFSQTSKILLIGSEKGYKVSGKDTSNGKTATYDSLAGGMQSDSVEQVDDDYSIFSKYKQKASYGSTIDEVVVSLNQDAEKGEKYEVVDRNGVKYIKVQHPSSRLARYGDLLYAFDSIEE